MSPEDRVAAVLGHVTRDRLLGAVTGVVDIASPTGAEGELARWLVDRMAAGGLRAVEQRIDARQSNAIGVLPGGTGPSVLLYAPLDTFTTGDPAYDVPGAAAALTPDMLPRATVHGDLVEGLGAGNPKGHAACVLVALEALAAAGVEPSGDVVAGFGAGGMPAFAHDGGDRANTGHGVGATHLLERGFSTDHAVIAKPGWRVSYEEVGLVWLDVVVPGTHTYVGSRHRLPYRNAVALAGEVAVRLERWFEEYAARHASGTLRPQGIVASVRGGLDHLAAATPDTVRLRLDVRLTPDQSPASVTREVRAFLATVGSELGAALAVTQVAAVPGSRTAPESEVVRATVAAWEAVAGEAHTPVSGNSGATDANILRGRGVPTARVGMPKVAAGPDGRVPDFTRGMNLLDLAEARRLVEVLVRTVLLLQRPAAE
ncbi:hypothetical protein [Nocardioides sp. BYT-33-1]|uniref:hypothetical protein n=1 Tax=Nocardioides sp. BYT-33-1 TaxID=3416952 RepID=UPI003F530B6B